MEYEELKCEKHNITNIYVGYWKRTHSQEVKLKNQSEHKKM